MKYKRISKKPCMNDIGKKEFGFDYKEESIKYKYLIGERMNLSEWKMMGGCEKCNSYSEWEKTVMENNKAKTRKQLKEFDHYLENRINMIKPEKEVYIILCSVILTNLTTAFLENLEVTDNIVITENPIVLFISYVIGILLEIIAVFWVMYKVISPIWSTTFESAFFKEYQRVIRKMIKKRS